MSSKVKSILAFFGKRQIDLAAYFGMSKQTMNNKMNRDGWSAKDLVKIADFVGCKVGFILPDGQHIFFDSVETEEKGLDD